MSYQPPEPDSYECMLFHVEKVLAHLQESHDELAKLIAELKREQINDLAATIDEGDDESQARIAKIRAGAPKRIDVTAVVDGAHSFLLRMHELYLQAKKGG